MQGQQACNAWHKSCRSRHTHQCLCLVGVFKEVLSEDRTKAKLQDSPGGPVPCVLLYLYLHGTASMMNPTSSTCSTAWALEQGGQLTPVT
jgi:hypothetical protein